MYRFSPTVLLIASNISSGNYSNVMPSLNVRRSLRKKYVLFVINFELADSFMVKEMLILGIYGVEEDERMSGLSIGA